MVPDDVKLNLLMVSLFINGSLFLKQCFLFCVDCNCFCEIVEVAARRVGRFFFPHSYQFIDVIGSGSLVSLKSFTTHDLFKFTRVWITDRSRLWLLSM